MLQNCTVRRDFCNGAKAAPRRSLKWSVINRIGVDVIPDSFSCRHRKLSGNGLFILSRFLFASLCGKLRKMLFISSYFVLLSRKYVPVLCEDSSHNIPEVKRRGEYCTVGPFSFFFFIYEGHPRTVSLKCHESSF